MSTERRPGLDNTNADIKMRTTDNELEENQQMHSNSDENDGHTQDNDSMMVPGSDVFSFFVDVA
jgi:hypothetical protein